VSTVSTAAGAGTSGVIPCAVADGKPLDVTLLYTATQADGSTATSDPSVAVTMICANVPDSPAAPTPLLASLELILLEW
jgi:hypothetical protein